jgi:ABC-type multidrug transport system ATPase subunit
VLPTKQATDQWANLKVSELDTEDWDEDLDEFFGKVKLLVKPTAPVEVRYNELTWSFRYDTASQQIPTVGRTLMNMVQAPVRMAQARNLPYRPILHRLTGVISPAKMTLVLGKPGSGKTSFLKALTGTLPSSGRYRLTGDITFNGDTAGSGKFVMPRVASYVDQVDRHYATLTVAETIEFAINIQDPADVYRKANNLERSALLDAFSQKRMKVRHLMQLFGISHVKDTLVGDNLIRGVSGGQRKRVTLAEKVASDSCKVMLMDEVSTGLDSSTTFDIMNVVKMAATHMNITMVVALLQPPPEVFKLFDDVLILDGGHIIFQGPTQAVMPHFASLGYHCPTSKDEADFLQEVTAMEGRSFFKPTETQQLPLDSVEAFVSGFHQSEPWKTMQKRLEEPPPAAEWEAPHHVRYLMPFHKALKLLMVRQYHIVVRNTELVRAQIGQSVIMGLVAGSLFYQLPDDQYANRYGLFFQVAMMLALGGMPELAVVCGQRDVFYKQHDAAFYPTHTYVLAQSLVGIPLNLIMTVVYGSIMWWMCGLTSDDNGARFGFFLLISFVLAVANNQFLRFIAAIAPSVSLSTAVAGVFILLMIIFSGFIIAEDDMPGYWVWVFWLNPVAWALRAYTLLEFKSAKYDGLTPSGDRVGDLYLDAYGFRKDEVFAWGAVGYLFGFWLAMLALTTLALTYLRFTGHVGGPDETEKGAEQVEMMDFTRPHAASASEAEKVGSDEEGERKDLGLPFTPVTLTFKDVWYTVTLDKSHEKLDLLQGISGYFKPGTMTALMGSSGAGKTTLMDVLGGRKTGGSIRGPIKVNGHPKEKVSFARVSGYVEQTDLHSPHSTVLEALLFSARLRLDSKVQKPERHRFVHSVIKLLELEPIQDRMIGSDLEGGLSTEQRKRVTIGVELVANPSLLFLDEPTSGLDSRAAAVVMRVVANIARTGRTVVCTIHQPSSYLFEMFDNLLLLQKGGRTVYFGPLGEGSSDLIRFLQSIPGAPHIKPGANPATYMLEVIGAGTQGGSLRQDPSMVYQQSTLSELNAKEYDTLSAKGTKIEFEHMYAASNYAQMKALVIKSIKNYWRSPNYNTTRIVVGLLVALIFGSVYARSGVSTQREVVSRISVIFMAAAFVSVIYMNSVIETMMTERAVFYRERAANMYRTLPYVMSFVVSEMPYIVGNTLLFSVVFYFTVGLYDDADKFLWFWLYFTAVLGLATFTGQTLAVLMPNAEAAGVIASLVLNLWVSFCGFLISPGDIPAYWDFMYWISPFHYLMEGLVTTQFHGVNDQISVVTEAGPVSMTVAEYVDFHFGGEWKYSHRWGNVIVLMGFVWALHIVRALALQYLNMLKR